MYAAEIEARRELDNERGEEEKDAEEKKSKKKEDGDGARNALAYD